MWEFLVCEILHSDSDRENSRTLFLFNTTQDNCLVTMVSANRVPHSSCSRHCRKQSSSQSKNAPVSPSWKRDREYLRECDPNPRHEELTAENLAKRRPLRISTSAPDHEHGPCSWSGAEEIRRDPHHYYVIFCCPPRRACC